MHFVEVVPNSTSSTAPGWAYVADTGYKPESTKLQPANRKRNARIGGGTGAETTARHQAAIVRRLAELDKDNAKDVHIPVPSRQGGGRVTKGKTANTRKILVYQKTFANWLADEEALAAQEAQAAPSARSRQTVAPAKASQTPATEPATKVQEQENSAPTRSRQSSQHPSRRLLLPDDSRLLEVNVPSAPPEELMETLLTAPPLSYNAARALPSSSGLPIRHFCEICGYWGLIKCTLCGSRVCGLDCKRTHDEAGCQKYGS